jgi:uncharacterized protein YbbK (DUF523 family)
MKKPNVSHEERRIWLVSSCLVGLKTRYDGKSRPSLSCLEFLKDKIWLPVCPEQLGGLPTPRDPAKITDGNGYDVLSRKTTVMTVQSVDVSCEFISGARAIFTLVKMQKIAGMCVKARSPSCGLHEILGVTSALLLQEGVNLKEF